MKVTWDPKATKGKRKVANYIRIKFGIDRVKRFRQEVDQTVDMIMRHPNLGSIDPLFNDRPRTYRSVIINGLSKMVYFIDDEIIYIAAFWDCRQEPTKQASEVK